ncbi:MAG TPA: ABC transporter permease [Gemmatimonadales bacterium]
MSVFEAVRMALGMIRAQKMKSFFSAVGAFVGVTFLIGVIAIVNGMDKYMREDFAGKLFGVNTFTVRFRPQVNFGPQTVEQRRELRRRPRIKDDDYVAVRDLLEDRPGTIVANESEDNVTVYYGTRRSRNVDAKGVTDTWFRIRDVEIDQGRSFSRQEVENGADVIVVGSDIAKKFFSGVDPLGHVLRIESEEFRIIGVAKSQGSLFGMSLDKFVIAPYTSSIKHMVNPHKIVDGIIVKTADIPTMKVAMEDVEGLMRTRRHLRPGQDDNFHLETADDVLDFWSKISRILFLALPMLVGISLVVGGIVIMNIMLMAVAERTREIGVRKALGARRRDILRQFVVEAATLSTTGALLGIVTGIALAKIVKAAFSLPATITPGSIIGGVLLGVGVGVIFGVYPASRAARLDPIAALRFE